MTSCYNSENNITLPFVTPKDCDTIIAEQSITMLRSIPIVYAINVKDSLNMNLLIFHFQVDFLHLSN